MNSYQLANLRRQVIRGLAIAGATTCTVTHTERDANGMPTGREVEVAQLYGLRYQRTSQLGDLLQIAMPGVVESGSGSWRWIGVQRQGTTPQAGDMLHGQEAETMRIAGIQENMGVLQMTLG